MHAQIPDSKKTEHDIWRKKAGKDEDGLAMYQTKLGSSSKVALCSAFISYKGTADTGDMTDPGKLEVTLT